VAFFYARWTGWGILTFPVLTVSLCGGSFAAVALFPDLARSHGDGIDRSGIPLGGAAAGLIIGGVLVYLLGLVLNRRQQPDGSRFWTDRHGVNELPVEILGRRTVIFGVLLLPVATIGFVPAAVVWALLLSWAAVIIAALVVLARRRKARLAGD
jgi:hypothetical protein